MKVTPAKLARSFALLLPVLLAGCLQPMGERISLERRDVERRDRGAEAKAPPPPMATSADATLAGDLAAMLAAADKAEANFALARSPAQQATAGARGKAVGSEDWSVAQTRISALDAPRRELSNILGDLEELYVARLQKEAAGEVKPGGSDQIDQARQHVLALLDVQDRIISDLKASLAN